MNLIITAGGTRERIDAVRAITNDATGRLGSLIGEEFSQRLVNQEHNIYYLCGMGAVTPNINNVGLHIIYIEGTDQLLSEMKRLLTSLKIDAVIHSMAVSDYKVSNVTTLEEVTQTFYQEGHKLLNKGNYEDWQKAILKAVQGKPLIGQQKISSDLDHPLLMLEKTPKIIGMIKEASPQTTLVGFKLLSGVSKENLIDTAYNLLLKNKCDYVLANDTHLIREDKHVGYLIDKEKNYKTFTNKKEIAKGIADCLLIK